ncbi:MAG: tetratricopeptide repeat protein [Bacteroidetes bacterium]|nr:tetratricopeptide repeat protein [Bacteroidota bacterium]
MDQAKAFYRDGDFASVITSLNACEDSIKGIDGIELLASAYFLSGDLTNSNRLIKLISDSVTSISAKALKARIAFARSEYVVAYNLYAKLLEMDSTNSTYLRQLAACADMLDSTDQAIYFYQKALEINPEDMVSGLKLIHNYLLLDDVTAADSLSLKLIAIDSLPDLLFSRGNILYRLKDYTQAFSCYKPLLVTKPSDSELYKKAGICKFLVGENDLAIALLSTANSFRSNDEVTSYYLGMAHQVNNDFKKAELFLKGAIQNAISQNMSTYCWRLAVVYESEGSYSKAIETYQLAYKYADHDNSKSAEIQYEIGRVYETHFGDYKNAIKFYQNYLNSYADTSDEKYKDLLKKQKSLLEKSKSQK